MLPTDNDLRLHLHLQADGKRSKYKMSETMTGFILQHHKLPTGGQSAVQGGSKVKLKP